jgi:hypothetical protein
MRSKTYQDIYTLDAIAAEILSTESWEMIEDRNPDAWNDAYCFALAEAKKAGCSDLEAEERACEAESAARDISHRNWKDAVLLACDEILEPHKLAFQQLKTRPWCYRLIAATTWTEAASRIVDTINGVGQFYFSSVKEFCAALPATTRGAVLAHLHWMKRRPDVYGTKSVSRMMEGWDQPC